MTIATETANSRSPVTCTERGCAEISNGIAPYEKCSTHYRRYAEFVAEREWLAELIANVVDETRMAEVVRELLSPPLIVLPPLTPESAAELDAVVAGAVMDEIAERAARDNRHGGRALRHSREAA